MSRDTNYIGMEVHQEAIVIAVLSAQHVTWMIALVSTGSFSNTSMALMVGRISNLTL